MMMLSFKFLDQDDSIKRFIKTFKRTIQWRLDNFPMSFFSLTLRSRRRFQRLPCFSSICQTTLSGSRTMIITYPHELLHRVDKHYLLIVVKLGFDLIFSIPPGPVHILNGPLGRISYIEPRSPNDGVQNRKSGNTFVRLIIQSEKRSPESRLLDSSPKI